MSAEDRWIAETLHEGRGVRTLYRAGRMIREEQTEHQHLSLFEHPYYGKVLVLDGAVQVASRDEFIYHEMMSHVPLMAHGNAQEVLIIGGGDCGIAKEVVKHKGVRRLVQVEIDPRVVEFSKEHFPEFAGPAFADPRFESVIADGMDFVAEAERRYDIIIVDSTDPQGPGEVLFSWKFYEACRCCLKRGGVMVTQNGVPFFQPDELASSLGHFKKLFERSGCYVAAIPTYVGGHMAIGWASDWYVPVLPLESIEDRYAEAGRFATRYWTPWMHRSAFALPRFIEEIAEKA